MLNEGSKGILISGPKIEKDYLRRLDVLEKEGIQRELYGRIHLARKGPKDAAEWIISNVKRKN